MMIRSRTNTNHNRSTVWAVGGGKGGIGKSFISSNLAICLAKMGKDVTLIDLDLGGANLHTCLGIRAPEQTLSDFMLGKTPEIKDLAVKTEITGLKFVSGFHDTLDSADISFSNRQRLMDAIRDVPSDYVVLDLGAGTSESTLDFFLLADQKVVAVTPEPTSIENAYRFIKSAYYRRLRQAEADLGFQVVVDAAMNAREQYGIRCPADLLRHLYRVEPDVARRLSAEISDFQVNLLVNQVRTREDADLGHSIKSVCRKYFGFEACLLGHVDHDNAVWQSLRKRRPLVVEFPYSSVVGQFLSITKNLLHAHSLRAVI